MLRCKVYQEYARWWEFWLSKLPQSDASPTSRGKEALRLRAHSLFMAEHQLRFLRNPAGTISPLLCPTGEEDSYIDEES